LSVVLAIDPVPSTPSFVQYTFVPSTTRPSGEFCPVARMTTQTPPVQVPWHARPHDPQLLTSVVVSTHDPLQACVPFGHAIHAPLTHAALAPWQLHVTVPPHPLPTGPQLAPVHGLGLGVHPQTLGLEGVPPPHWLNPAHVPQDTAGHVPWMTVPQLSPAGHVVGHVLTHWPLPLHISLGPHVPQWIMPPQPSGCVPHFCPPAHALIGAQPHTFAIPPPPHVCGELQLPQDTTVPQLFVALPQVLFAHAVVSSATHAQCVVGVPVQVWPTAHATQTAGSPHPWFASSGTHWLPHFLVPAPHTPTTHAPPLQMRVPAPGAGQLVASHATPQPYVGSSTDTHCPEHFFVPAPHVPMTHVDPWQTSVPVPLAGQDELSHVAAPQPKVGSSMETHWPPQRLKVAVQGTSAASALGLWVGLAPESP